MYKKSISAIAVFGLIFAAAFNAEAAELRFGNSNGAQWEAPWDPTPGLNGGFPIFPAGAGDEFLIQGEPVSSLIGALIQVIHDVDADGPDVGAVDEPARLSGTGVFGDDVVVASAFVGEGVGGINGIFAGRAQFADMGISDTDNVFIRIFDRPSANYAGSEVPSLYNYGLNAEAQAATNYGRNGWEGYFYYDTPTRLLSSLIPAAGIYNYIPVGSGTTGIPNIDGSADWSFAGQAVVVPEPATFILAGLGLLGVFVKRRRK